MILYLAALAPGVVVAAKDISVQPKVPMRFLGKALRSPVTAGILSSYRGPERGYALAR